MIQPILQLMSSADQVAGGVCATLVAGQQRRIVVHDGCHPGIEEDGLQLLVSVLWQELVRITKEYNIQWSLGVDRWVLLCELHEPSSQKRNRLIGRCANK